MKLTTNQRTLMWVMLQCLDQSKVISAWEYKKDRQEVFDELLILYKKFNIKIPKSYKDMMVNIVNKGL